MSSSTHRPKRFCFEYPAQVTAPITRELEEKFFLMEAVGDMPDVTRDEVVIFARHRLP
jgi:hypothetical protein